MKKSLRNLFLSSMILTTVFAAVSCNKSEGTSESQNSNKKVEWSDKVLEKTPFTKGVNFTLWFEAWNPGVPNLRLYDKSDFENVKSLGCDVIRLPIHFDMFVEDKETGKIKDIIFEYLDKACDWAEELGIYLIIDDHSFNGLSKYPVYTVVEDHLLKTWPQIAEHFKNRSDYIIYEILNEPQIGQSEWYLTQLKALKAIRQIDRDHTVVVTGADWGSIAALTTMVPYQDKNLIYTYHFYDPYRFTHQSASWADLPTACLENIPFPYDAERMPALRGQAKKLENEMTNSYPRSGTVEALRETMKKVADFGAKNNVPLWCGEMGVHNVAAPEADRNYWYKAVNEILTEFNIPYCVWGLNGSFGLYNKGSQEIFPNDLNVELVKGLGMNVPEMKEITEGARSKYVIYDDFGGRGITFNSWMCKSTSYDYSEDKAEGSLCIKWSDSEQYGAIAADLTQVDFTPVADLADKSNAVFSFSVKFTDPSQGFQIRFVDNDGGSETSRPWRLSYDVKASNQPLNEWKTYSVPVNQMIDTGAWSNRFNQWYESEGKFSWNYVNQLEIACEFGNFTGDVFIDDIKLELTGK